MFFIVSWAMVYHWLTDIAMIMMTVTTLVVTSEEFMKDSDRCAPKSVEAWTSSASWAVSGPMESWFA